ncbi:uncharacterized protein LOC127277443 [Leptopilina boulardi]|uniref:uncharacterized protein LOC127277443 n=1 Tax=Leptopilina boulardi TaxID=63433 RepID=UPI0021F5B8D3|nr:uncharacterized protein LOC127277443 [Leptopilina boulardi]
MNSTSVFIQQSSNFQFLSVCHYISIFGVYFYNKDLITLEQRCDSIFILNTLFEYLNKSPDELEAKFQLLKKVLKGSDLYGGEKNETLDMKYVNETYHYIISEALFSHYGNINGYLAKIINNADNVNYSVLKEKVLQHLSENYTSREYCFNNIPQRNNSFKNNPLGNYCSKNNPQGNNSSKLNGLTIKKVFNNYIWQIFPQPEHEMSIMEVNYIYAMAGLKIIKSVSSTTPNLTFQEYILISREIDLQNFSNEIYELVLNLFSTPALFFYAYKQKAKFQKIDFTLTNEFWIEAYQNLFTHISSTMQQIVRKRIENNLYYKFEKEMNTLKSRTVIATNILRLHCDYENNPLVSETDVYVYKTFYSWMTKLILPKHCQIDSLPDLETVFQNQFKVVENIYNAIEKHAIEKVLIDSNLIEKLNSNSIVLFARIPPEQMYEPMIAPVTKNLNKDIYLTFVIIKNGESEYYAIRQEKNNLNLLINRGNEKRFSFAVAKDASVKLEIDIVGGYLKEENEDYKMFIQRIADIKTEKFLTELKNHYREPTSGEKILDFLKSFIPFYSCIESIIAKDVNNAISSCFFDALTLIPFAGLAAKYTTKITSALAIEISEQLLMKNSLVSLGILQKLTITTAFRQIGLRAVQTIANQILTRNLLKDFGIATLRTFDPGFEFLYQLGNSGYRTFKKLFQNLITNFKNIPTANEFLLIIKSFLVNVKRNINLQTDNTGLVPFVLAKKNNLNIVRYIYPGGSHFFGPKCLIAAGKTMELRSIEWYSFPNPVVAEKSSNGIFYKQYNPKTGGTIDGKLKMNSDDILHRVGNLINEMVINGRDFNIIRNYHVYHNTITWNNYKAKQHYSLNEESLNRPIEGLNEPIEDFNEAQYPTNARENIVQQNFQQITNFQSQESLNLNFDVPHVIDVKIIKPLSGNVGGFNFPLIPQSEAPGTSNTNSPKSFLSKTLIDILNEGEKPPPPPIVKLKHDINSDFHLDKSLEEIVTGGQNDGHQLLNSEISDSLLDNNFFSQNRMETSEILNTKLNSPKLNSPKSFYSKTLVDILNEGEKVPLTPPIPLNHKNYVDNKFPKPLHFKFDRNLEKILTTGYDAHQLVNMEISESILNNNFFTNKIIETPEIDTNLYSPILDSPKFFHSKFDILNNEEKALPSIKIDHNKIADYKFPKPVDFKNLEEILPNANDGDQLINSEISETLLNNNFFSHHEIKTPIILEKKSNSPKSFLTKTLIDILNEGEKAPPHYKFNKNLKDHDKSAPINNELENSKFSLKRKATDDNFDANIPEKKKKLAEGKENQLIVEKNSIIDLNPKLYKKIMKQSIYSSYVEILMLWKRHDMPFIKLDREKYLTLRNTVNNLALFQLDQGFPLNIPKRLWYNQIIKGSKNINFMENLKGSKFFFNDITLLVTNQPNTLLSEGMRPFDSEIEVRYHLTINSPFGFVDLTNFHYSLRNNYVTFSDVLFTVTNTFYSNKKEVLNIFLTNHDIGENIWRKTREEDIKNLLTEDKIIKHPRMKSILTAANFISEEAPFCTFVSSKNLLSTYILKMDSTIKNHVPTYDKFATDIININSINSYNEWKIPKNRYIEDVLLNHNLDEIIHLSEATRRIIAIYDFVYIQNIEQAFHKYRMLFNIEQHIRFEDYYVLYSYINDNLELNINGIRRLEVAINRLAIRQSSGNRKLFKLHRAELIETNVAENIKQLFNEKQIFTFNELKRFSLHRDIEEIQFIDYENNLSEIPLLMEVTLNNQVGLSDVNGVIVNDNLSYVITANFEFILDDIKFETIFGQKVMVIKMHDYESPTEKRIIQMANRLHELLSTETKFYSNLDEME